MKQEQGLTRQQVFGELVKSPHGKLEDYLPIGQRAAREDPDFFAHLIAWNARKGTIRDSFIALPLIAVDGLVPAPPSAAKDPVLMNNALSHVALLRPRELLRAVRFAKAQKLNGRRQALLRLVRLYIQSLESNHAKWERTVIQHRKTLNELYTFCHVKPGVFQNDVLFHGLRPPGSALAAVVDLKTMSEMEAAGEMTSRKIPFLVASPALGDKKKNPDVLVALMNNMSPAELTGHMKMLDRLGVRQNPALRSALEKALGRMVDGKSSALKITKALEKTDRGGEIEDDEFRDKLKAVQEKKLDKSSVDGNWLVLGDRSSSMRASINMAKQIAALLARMVRGSVYLVFFDTSPTYYDVSGKTLEEITNLTRLVSPGGNTSIGVGVRWANEKGLDLDGIAIASDGGENTAPAFSTAYAELTKRLGKQIPAYLYHVPGDPNVLSTNCKTADIELTEFDVAHDADYYSLPNLVATMRTNRYSLIDEIMDTPLLTLDQVLQLRQPVYA
jgi:hypothetical protein